MPRIPEKTLEKIKREVSIQSLVEAKGIKLTPHGKNLIGLCPFHDDKDPSLVITPDKNLWHCLGACQIGGSVIDWVMQAEGVSFRHAAEILLNNPKVLAEGNTGITKCGTVRKLSSPVKIQATDQEALKQVVEYYHETLKNNPEGMEYLRKRGLIHPELINKFKLGYSNRTLGFRLPAKNRKTGLEIRGKLQNLGIIRKTGHEHFSGSIVFPIIDEQENITEVYGRKIRDNLRSGTAYHLYLPGPHAGALNIKNILAAKEIILCESIIDALTFWTYGFENVTASYGVEGFTQEILDKLVEIHPEKVLIAYDRDLAGDKAAKKVAAKLSEHGIESYRINFPKDMDANQYAIETKNPTKSLARVIRNAYWLGGSRKKAAKKESKIAPVKQDALKTDTSFLNAKEDFQIEQKTNEIKIEFGNRKYRIRGMQRNMSFDVLKINLLVKIEDAFYVDTLDLYSARQRAGYIKQTAKELNLKEDVIKKDLGKLLLKLEEIQEENINRVLAPKEKKPILTEEERKQALAFLKNPNLIF
jgi:DNA primase catalytic core